MDLLLPLGIFLILIGALFVTLSLANELIDFSSLPWWLVYVYKRNGFYFVTSPALILLVSIILLLMKV